MQLPGLVIDLMVAGANSTAAHAESSAGKALPARLYRIGQRLRAPVPFSDIHNARSRFQSGLALQIFDRSTGAIPITTSTDRELFERPLFERYTFVMVTTQNLASARKFWVEQLGFLVTEERPGQYFIVDAGGLRLWIDLKENEERVVRGSDPAIGLQVRSVEMVLNSLAARGISEKVEALC